MSKLPLDGETALREILQNASQNSGADVANQIQSILISRKCRIQDRELIEEARGLFKAVTAELEPEL